MSENSKIEWTDHTFNPWERLPEGRPRLRSLPCRGEQCALRRRHFDQLGAGRAAAPHICR